MHEGVCSVCHAQARNTVQALGLHAMHAVFVMRRESHGALAVCGRGRTQLLFICVAQLTGCPPMRVRAMAATEGCVWEPRATSSQKHARSASANWGSLRVHHDEAGTTAVRHLCRKGGM